MSLLHALRQADALRAVDLALVESLQRLQPGASDVVLAAAALAALGVAQGDAALDLARPQRVVDAELTWPQAEDWARVLAGSPLVSVPARPDASAAAAPLVLENGLLYLRRYHEYERSLALGLRRVAGVPLEPAGKVSETLLDTLFPVRDATAGADHRRQAAELALRQALVLITGGPGTGKTTTIAKLLILRIAQTVQSGASLRIALAAPTGRAADRMLGSLRHAAEAMREAGVDAAMLAQLPQAAFTLHRLLGAHPDTPKVRHHAENPLPFDIVVVDEASMVDLPMMCKLVDAVSEGAQLVLLGDADQLPSVEAGDVLAAIVQATAGGKALQGLRVHLQRGWRQSASLQLAPLADAARQGDADAALALLRSGQLGNVQFHEGAADPLVAHPPLLAHWRGLADLADPALALAQAGRVRLLTALRDGPQGARTLNAWIEARLTGQRLGTPPRWYPGRLLLVTENSPRNGLFNGDVGICLADPAGVPLVWFAGGSAGVRGFHPAMLPAHEAAFAMTVHKAQGSEFDEVWLQLPQHDARVLSRELVYTGLTRARSHLHLAASETVLRTALGRHVERVSGLAWRLAAPSRQPRGSAATVDAALARAHAPWHG